MLSVVSHPELIKTCVFRLVKLDGSVSEIEGLTSADKKNAKRLVLFVLVDNDQ
jgi:hypothetical protein